MALRRACSTAAFRLHAMMKPGSRSGESAALHQQRVSHVDHRLQADGDAVRRIHGALDREKELASKERMLKAGGSMMVDDDEPASCKLVFLGGPGVGKGTYAGLLAKKLGVEHISTGQLVREELARGVGRWTVAPGELALRARVREAMEAGRLLPDEVVLQLLARRVREVQARAGSEDAGYVLDGFPRTVAQARILDEALAGSGVDLAFNLHIAHEEALVAKCLGRRSCPSCGRDYNLAHVDMPHADPEQSVFLPARLPPPRGAPSCCRGARSAGQLLARPDDASEEVVRQRLGVHAAESAALEAYYRSQGKLFNLNVGPGVDHVWPRLLHAALQLNYLVQETAPLYASEL